MDILELFKSFLQELKNKDKITKEDVEKMQGFYKELEDDDKEEVKEDIEAVEEAAKEDEKAKGGDNDDEAEKLAQDIAIKIAKINEDASKEAKEKAIKIAKSKEVKINDYDIKIADTSEGKEVTMKKSEVDLLGKWMKALMEKDNKQMFEIFQKLEPLNETTNADGGFLVPTLLHNAIIPLLEDAAVVRPKATIINMSGMKTNTLSIDGIVSKPIAAWAGIEQIDTDKATSSMQFNQISLTPYTLACIIPMSRQLRDDAPFNVVQLVVKAASEKIANIEDKAFMTGNGTSQPTGIDNYTFTQVNAANNLSYNHMMSAYWTLPQAYRKKAVWIMNSRTISAISTLADSNSRPLLLDNGILTKPGIPSIKGRPVLEQNDLGSDKIFFGDLKSYWIGDKQRLTIDIAEQASLGTGSNSINLWQRNMIAIKIEERVDGELTTTRSFVEITNTGVA